MKRLEQIGKGIKPEYRTDYEEIISDVVRKSAHKARSEPEEEPKKPDSEKRRTILSYLRNKFMAMTFAGFITLGGAWQESYADQVRVAKKQGETPTFVLETGVTDAKLKTFKQALENSEPEFNEWLENYVDSVGKDLDNLLVSVSGFFDRSNFEEERLIESELKNGNFDYSPEEKERIFDADHKIIKLLNKNPQFLKDYVDFIKSNLRDFVLANFMLKNSSGASKQTIRHISPPKIEFHGHDLNSFSATFAYTQHRVVGKKINSRIVILPGAFTNDDVLDKSRAVNNFFHELVHGLHPAVDEGGRKSDFKAFLGEGITQNITFEIMQYLSNQNQDIRPAVGYIEYDQRVIIASILDGILRSYGKGDYLSMWYVGLIDDKIFLKHLKEALESLGIDKKIADDLKNSMPPKFKEKLTGEDLIDIIQPSFRPMVNLLVSLKISGLELSPQFVKSILTRGRLLNDEQVKGVEEFVKEEYLSEKLAKAHAGH